MAGTNPASVEKAIPYRDNKAHNVSKPKNARGRQKKKQKKATSLERSATEKEVERLSWSYSYTSYTKAEIGDLCEAFEPDLLHEFLLTESVSGGDQSFSLHNIILMDNAKIICSWISTIRTREKKVFGICVVGYFAPMKAAVLNLTVIFEGARGQRNLDPMNNVSILIYLS